MSVFVTVGSQKFPFNRLLRAVDDCVKNGVIEGSVFAQTGSCDYVPHTYDYAPYLDRESFSQRMETADVVITHGGTGAIVSALKKSKRVIAMARLARFGEHVDDHQLQILSAFEGGGYIFTCEDTPSLIKAYALAVKSEPIAFQSNNTRFIADLDLYLSGA